MPTAIEELKTYNVKGVEIFSAGTWNEDKYTVENLYQIVDSFNALKRGWRPYLKLGHDKKQKIANSSGLPALGHIESVYVRGDKLIADFESIPEKLFKLIKSKAYNKVSCEIYSQLDVSGVKYPLVLGAVALLGAENPGVMNLDEILGQYCFLDQAGLEGFAQLEKQDTFKSYSHTLEMQEEEMPELQEQLDASKRDYANLETEKKALEEKAIADAKELADLKEFKAKAEKEASETAAENARLAAEAKASKLAEFTGKLEAQKLVTPATKPLVTQLLEDVKEFSIGEGKDKKSATREEIVEKILTLTAEAGKVNLEERSSSDYGKKGGKDEAAEESDKEIQQYMKDNKCDYAKAYKAVMKSSKKS